MQLKVYEIAWGETATSTGAIAGDVVTYNITFSDQGVQGPTGATGPAGPSNVLNIGTVTTGAPGSNASATITGTSPGQILSLTIPRGAVGATGATGPAGPQADINYTVVSGPMTLSNSQNIAADTSGGTFTLTLPANPDAGDAVDIYDYAETFGTNNLTIARNGSRIESLEENLICNVSGAYFTIIYTGITRGWQIVPRFGTSGAGGETVLTTQGDTLYRGLGVNQRLPIGSPGHILKVNSGGTAPEWGAAPATGVTSVALSSSDLTVSGSPVTSSGTITANLVNSGVTAGTYSKVTVDAKGRVTTGATAGISDVTGLQSALDGKQASGNYATLVSGKVPSDQLPSFVDDVVEYANLAAFPVTGESGKIFVAIDTRKTYRWSGSAYVEISPSAVTSVNGATGAVILDFAESEHSIQHEAGNADELRVNAALVATVGGSGVHGVYFADGTTTNGKPNYFLVGTRKNTKLQWGDGYWELIKNLTVEGNSLGVNPPPDRPWEAEWEDPRSPTVISSITVTRLGLEEMVQKLADTSITSIATTSEDGLLSASDKTKLDGLGTASTKDVAPSGNASSTQVVLGNDSRLSDARTPSSTLAHAASHASSGSDPLAPSDIGAQSLFTSASQVLSADFTLTSGRATKWRLQNYNGTTYNVTLPTTNIQAGDVVVVSAGTLVGFQTIREANVGGGSFVTLATLSEGQSYRFVSTGTASNSWEIDQVYTHTHAASVITSGTLTHERGGLEADVSAYNGLVKISGGSTSAVGIGTGSTEVAAGDHVHGNLTNDGKIGSTAGLPVVTTTAGAVTTLALGTANQVLRVNSGASGVEFADPSGGGGEVRFDTSGSYTYTGQAAQGSSESSAVWFIRRSEFSSAGAYVSTTTANNVQWANRLTASYS